MDFTEYLQQSARTAPSDSLPADSLVHAALGLTTEIVELNQAYDAVNAVEEIGDFMWYMALLARFCGAHSREEILSPGMTTFSLATPMTYIAIIADEAKRFKFYGKPPDIRILKDAWSALYLQMQQSAFGKGRTIEQVCYLNIEKLRIRYPEKFSAEQAVVRDLPAERVVLESAPSVQAPVPTPLNPVLPAGLVVPTLRPPPDAVPDGKRVNIQTPRPSYVSE